MEELIDDYIKFVSPTVFKEDQNLYAIRTTFLDQFNDSICLYARVNDDFSEITIEDNGDTLCYLDDPEDIFKFKGTEELFDNIVKIKLNDGVLSIKTTRENFGKDLHFFIQNLIELNCLMWAGEFLDE